MKIFAVNPGSTSTKVALIRITEPETEPETLFSGNVAHDANVLSGFHDLTEQFPYRKDTVLQFIEENNLRMDQVDAFVGRGGGLMALEGGTYEVTDLMVEHALKGANGVQHPANLGQVIARWLGDTYGKPSYMVNSPDVDELQDIARVTGIRGVERIIHLHALNLKETAIRHALNMGERYEEENYVVCHIGGGISVSAHRKGRMIDGFDIAGGEGPMAPTRCGSISVADLLDYAADRDWEDVRKLCTKSGGFVSLMGTSDAQQVSRLAESGEPYAKLVWEAMIYQIEKCIGSMAAALRGDVRAVLLGGGLVHNQMLVDDIKSACSFIAPVYAYPGEFEMEAMAAGAARVLSGREKVKIYTGIPCWQGFRESEEEDNE